MGSKFGQTGDLRKIFAFVTVIEHIPFTEMPQSIKLRPSSEPHLYKVIVVGHLPAIGLRCIDPELLAGLNNLQLGVPWRK